MTTPKRRTRKRLTNATKVLLEQIVRLVALNKTPEEIAHITGKTQVEINELTRHPDYQALQKSYMGEMYAPVDKMIQARGAGQLLESAAPDAAEALIELLTDEDPSEQRRAATAILDRSGFGPIQRKAVKKYIELDPVSAHLLSKALGEADSIIEAEVVEDD